MAPSGGRCHRRGPAAGPDVWRRGKRRPSSRQARRTFWHDRQALKRSKTRPSVRGTPRSASLTTCPSAKRSSPVGSGCWDGPRST